MLAPPAAPGPQVARELLAALPERLTAAQAGFAATGGLHATGLFDAAGELLLAREDVGRHNAMDKVIGHALAAGLVPLHGHLLCVSGRLSFELVQKAAVAGAPVLVGVGAPTSLAVAARARAGDDAVRLRARRSGQRLRRSGAREPAPIGGWITPMAAGDRGWQSSRARLAGSASRSRGGSSRAGTRC